MAYKQKIGPGTEAEMRVIISVPNRKPTRCFNR